MDEMFAKLDADGNGAIDRAEFDKYHERMHDMHDMHEQQDKAAPAPAADEHADHH
jgi:Ca2+-binding EF-hand superfamily protein